jgi:chemotaxis protein MotB
MPTSARLALLCAGLIACGPIACMGNRPNLLRQSQYRSMQLWQQNQAMAAQNQMAQGQAGQLAAEKAQLQQQLAAAQSAQDTLQQRVNNLQSERQELQQRYLSLVNRTKTEGSPLSDKTTQELEDLAKRFPNFDFDPQTGVSKFHSDILFESGSAELRSPPPAELQEFARILNSGDAQALNILVVGHTDDRPIVKAATKAKHRDNWELSADRALNVTRAMSKLGIKERRMGVAGYGQHQPLVPNTDNQSRQKNRRVEIFVLAPNAAVAGWDQQPKN